MKVEEGVMVVKDGKAWGVVWEDGYSTSYGWMDIESAPIHDPQFCLRTTDITYQGSHYIPELLTGKLVKVRRTTTVEIL